MRYALVEQMLILQLTSLAINATVAIMAIGYHGYRGYGLWFSGQSGLIGLTGLTGFVLPRVETFARQLSDWSRF